MLIFWPEKLHWKKCVGKAWIFQTSKYIEKTTLKKSGYFEQRNYTKKVRENNVDFPTIEITPKIVCENGLSFWTIEITSKKSTWKRRGFFDQQNYVAKIRGKDVEIRQNLVFDVST